MVTKATITVPSEIRAADGEICAYFLPAAEVDRMRAEIEALRQQVKKLERQRDIIRAERDEMVLTWCPPPMTAEEIAEALRNPGDISALLAELEKK